jgi:rod shape-determining protein MreC
MENFFSRYKNPLVLMAVLFIQVIALATQVKARGTAGDGPLLIRVWTVTAITPFERAFVSTGHFFRNTWRGYIDLRNVRKQNTDLQEELGRLRLENARLKTDVDQNRRLQTLLDFKERYAGQTVAAQVIGSGGSEQSHIIYIDKHTGLKPDMAVITPNGIVGKIKEVYPMSSQVLLINDHDSGAGVVLENSRLQGVLRGTDLGDLKVDDIMSDEKVDVGERVITSGGDRIYPKGLPVGTVNKVTQESDTGPFLTIKVKPAADLNRLEEVLVITSLMEEVPSVKTSETPRRAADVLAQRLPSVPKATPTPSPKAANPAASPSPATAGVQNGNPGDQKKSAAGVQTANPDAQKKSAVLNGAQAGSPSATPTATPAVKKSTPAKAASPEKSPSASPTASPIASPTVEPEKPPR